MNSFSLTPSTSTITLPESNSISTISHNRISISHHLTNPNGPHHITCLHSDALQSRWPAIGPTPPGLKGASAQWGLTDARSKTRSKWLSTLGRALAEILGLMKSPNKEDWKLTDFPENYQLFTYTKGNRQDQYLIGSQTVLKFRTANEFLPHLHWLTSSNPTTSCQCKYCSGIKTHSEVNLNLALGAQQPPKASRDKRKSGPPLSINVHNSTDDSAYSPFNERPSKKRRSQDRPSTTPTAPPQSVKSDDSQTTTKPTFQGPYLNPQVNRDLGTDRSNFREHELVWCQITDLSIGPSTPASPRGFDLGTHYWPGFCEEAVLVTQSKAFYMIDDDENVRELGEKVEESLSWLTGAPSLSLKKQKNERLKPKPKPALKQLEHNHKYQWKVRLLGLEEVMLREEDQLLPWLFKPLNLAQKFGKGPDRDDTLPQHLSDPRNFQRPRLNSFCSAKDARIVFQLALQFAANLEEFWGMCDRYDYEPDHGNEPDSDSTHLSRRPLRAYDLPGAAPGPALNSPRMWFQCLWWGAEKIWIHDLVRMNKLESDLPVDLVAKDTTVRHINTHDKAYFLKIFEIYRDQHEKKVVIMGKIFDLVAISQNPQEEPKFEEILESEEKTEESPEFMPSAPVGFRFRQLTPTGLFHHVHLECISGRYYSPAIKNRTNRLSEISRRLFPKVSHALKPGDGSSDPILKTDNLICINSSLFGFTAGRWNYMRCRKWQPDRMTSIIHAERQAQADVRATCAKLVKKKILVEICVIAFLLTSLFFFLF
ncbi:hypothetical protein CROQUDRAFT_41188 [Cronartium quercuum f. sp. fusiforme G11]|uniref:Cryptic loci regulator 2 N-terminal domain-containing protein n=1 Tax=Cronartium quercuum f. sp. fusiforme G11 TaxID=708437 RepID=A0A9P6NQU1_9BASI|nr:hypothetical protein CROQUDRAFT_41188 [Cronartium quercuum f. sp. fusiforme G11]